MLLRYRSGRTAALVLAGGFGGGTMLLGVGSVLATPAPMESAFGALFGYFLAAMPFFVFALLVGVSRSELWYVPEQRLLKLLTYRPWRRGPRVEQAPIEEYSGVRTEAGPETDGGGTVVALVTKAGESIPLREFTEEAEAKRFAATLSEASGLWLRHGTEPASPEKKDESSAP